MSSQPRRTARPPIRLVGVAMVALLAMFAIATPGTLGGWTSGSIENDTNSAGTGQLSFVHTYPTACSLTGPASSTACAGTIAATTAAGTSPASTTDTIADHSLLPSGQGLTEQVEAQSCAPVQQTNTRTATNPMLPRYNTTFQAMDKWTGTNAVSLDGSTGYLADALSQTQPNPGISLGSTYGLGVWFKTSSSSGGPLFEIGDNPTNTAGGDDRILYLNASGTLTFIQNTTGAASAKTTTTKQYNDGQWHFAYVTLSVITVVLSAVSTTTLYVDDDPAVTGGGALIGYTADTGYWHLGWAPTALTGLASPYLDGSLSNFVVFNTANAPAAPTSTQRASQAAFTTWASTATEHWLLGDPGTTTYTAAIGYLTGGDACTMDTLGWTLGASTAVSTMTLRALVNAGWSPTTPISAPTPGNTQTSTTSYARVASGYDTDVAGLHLYAPLAYRVTTSPHTAWSLTFTWPDATAAFIG